MTLPYGFIKAVLVVLMLLLAACKAPPPRYVPPQQTEVQFPQSRERPIVLADRVAGDKEADIAAHYRARNALKAALIDTRAPFGVLWRLARASFAIAHRLRNPDQRRAMADEGILFAHRALAVDAKRVEPHYYLALNYGELADARRSTEPIKPMIAAAQRAAKIDPRYAEAGPLVLLGKTYLEAPAWPVSVGDSEKAVAFLERAVAMAPRPLTRIFLAQAYYEDDQIQRAKRQLQAALDGAKHDTLEPRWRSEAETLLRKLR